MRRYDSVDDRMISGAQSFDWTDDISGCPTKLTYCWMLCYVAYMTYDNDFIITDFIARLLYDLVYMKLDYLWPHEWVLIQNHSEDKKSLVKKKKC